MKDIIQINNIHKDLQSLRHYVFGGNRKKLLERERNLSSLCEKMLAVLEGKKLDRFIFFFAASLLYELARAHKQHFIVLIKDCLSLYKQLSFPKSNLFKEKKSRTPGAGHKRLMLKDSIDIWEMGLPLDFEAIIFDNEKYDSALPPVLSEQLGLSQTQNFSHGGSSNDDRNRLREEDLDRDVTLQYDERVNLDLPPPADEIKAKFDSFLHSDEYTHMEDVTKGDKTPGAPVRHIDIRGAKQGDASYLHWKRNDRNAATQVLKSDEDLYPMPKDLMSLLLSPISYQSFELNAENGQNLLLTSFPSATKEKQQTESYHDQMPEEISDQPAVTLQRTSNENESNIQEEHKIEEQILPFNGVRRKKPRKVIIDTKIQLPIDAHIKYMKRLARKDEKNLRESAKHSLRRRALIAVFKATLARPYSDNISVLNLKKLRCFDLCSNYFISKLKQETNQAERSVEALRTAKESLSVLPIAIDSLSVPEHVENRSLNFAHLISTPVTQSNSTVLKNTYSTTLDAIPEQLVDPEKGVEVIDDFVIPHDGIDLVLLIPYPKTRKNAADTLMKILELVAKQKMTISQYEAYGIIHVKPRI